MSKISNKISLLARNTCMAICSLSWKRDASIVLMDSWFGKKFADNPRFLYQYLSENKDRLNLTHVVWVSRDESVVSELNEMGYEAYHINSEESIWYHKTARYLICNNAPVDYENISGEFLAKYSFGAKRINMWHGVGVVKGVGYDRKEYLDKKKKHLLLYEIKEFLHSNVTLFRKFCEWEGGWGDCYYISTTLSERTKMKKELLLPDRRFIITGYSRNCSCPRITEREKRIIETIRKHKHIVIYMPTFKTGDNNFDFRSVGLQISSFLEDYGVLWIQKGHSADKYSEDFKLTGNILSLSSDFDTNVILPYVDAVITDYSSAMMDGLYHQKPVLLYVPDYNTFVNGERGLIPEAEDIMTGCGYLYKDTDALIKGLVNTILDPESVKPDRYSVTRDTYWGTTRSLNQIWEDIIKVVG